MVFQHPDDPERGYVDFLEVEVCDTCQGRGEQTRTMPLGPVPTLDGAHVEARACPECEGWRLVEYMGGEPVEPVTDCSICEGPVNPASPNPLCARCEGTARATARYFPDGPEAFRQRMTDR